MVQKIYRSDFRTGPEATKKQQMLFAADVEFAFSEDWEYIQDSENIVFCILDKNTLVEVDLTEKDLQYSTPKKVKFDPTQFDNNTTLQEALKELLDEEYCVQCHNLMAIDQIINNTLIQSDKISSESCDNMLKLAHLKQLLKDS